MKVIDLLQRIANGEEVPRKFMVDGDTLYIGEDKFIEYENGKRIEWFIYPSWLNEEVEIIEEDKKIEPLECYVNAILTGCISKYYEEDFEESVKHNIDVLGTKINEIIDKINSMEDK